MRMLSFLFLLPTTVAFAGPPEADDGSKVVDRVATTPTDPSWLIGEAEAVFRLSVRDPEPSCAHIVANVPEPAVVLRHIVDTVHMPPWAPMRAASCLLADPQNANANALEWVSHPDTRGLALLVLGRIDHFDSPIALQIGRAALAGPWSSDARRHLQAAENPALRQLLALPPSTQ